MKTIDFSVGRVREIKQVVPAIINFYSNKTHHVNKVSQLYLEFDTMDHKGVGIFFDRKEAEKLVRAINKVLRIKKQLIKRKWKS